MGIWPNNQIESDSASAFPPPTEFRESSFEILKLNLQRIGL